MLTAEHGNAHIVFDLYWTKTGPIFSNMAVNVTGLHY
jgi:hypothetical protein